MRVLIASRVFPPDVLSGAATVVRNLWERLSEQHDVRLVAGYHRDASLLPPDARAVQIEARKVLRGRVGLELAVRRMITSWKPDVLVAHGIEIPVDLVPTVGLLTDPLAGSQDWGRLRGLRARVYRSRIEKMAVPVVPSQAACRRIADLGIRPDRLRVAWPGVDTTAFRPVDLAGDDRPLRLLYAARIVPGKGQHVAIEAVKGLHDSIRDRVTLDIAGPVVDREYFAALRRRAEGVPVHFHEDVPDLAPWYRESDIVLFPTLSEEVFGYSAVDGLAAGKPVIFSKCGAL
ncbi:MAG: glycosyltransferase family 4 protein, partial [Myxococcota bacterium]|nr:glycosyltransferase family 4 protein [Myxococcota bacterium]